MRIAQDGTIREHDALERIFFLSSPDKRVALGETPLAETRPERDSVYDPDKLSRWERGLAGALEEHERARAEAAPERAYIAAGRKARMGRFNVLAGEDAVSAPGLFSAAQSGGSGRAMAFFAGTPTPDGTRGAEAEPERGPDAGTERGASRDSLAGAENSGGGSESRSAQRTYLGGGAGSGHGFERGAGKENGKTSEEEASGDAASGRELTEEERLEVHELKARDREVRTHEQAHISAGGGLVVGGASYSKETGPDGRQYAVGGEVQIDTSEADTPEATIAKARRIRSAALAPAQPSSQDQQVAAQAAQMETTARQEKAMQRGEDPESGTEGENAAARTGEEDGEEQTASATRGMSPSRRAALAYAHVSGARPPAPLALGTEISLAV